MAIFVDTKYRIKRNSDYEEQMKYLIQEIKVFQSYSQVLMLSAAIGYKNDAFVPIENVASDGVLMQFFEPRDLDYMDFLAYSREKEQKILSEQRKYSIFEAYANGGFAILVNSLEIDFIEKSKNNRIDILRKMYRLLLTNGFTL